MQGRTNDRGLPAEYDRPPRLGAQTPGWPETIAVLSAQSVSERLGTECATSRVVWSVPRLRVPCVLSIARMLVVAPRAFAQAPAGGVAAAGQGKTDMVVLANGDRFTGEVSMLDQGQLRLKTDHLDTVSIEWAHVVRVTTRLQYDVETLTGTRYLGRLDSTADGRLTIVGTASTDTVEMQCVVRLVQIRSGFLKRIDGNLDFGFSFAQSSGVATYSVNGSAQYRRPAFELSLEASSTYTKQPPTGNRSR